MDLIAKIEAYLPVNEQEEYDKKEILKWLKSGEDVWTRNNTTAHMSASAWVTDPSHTRVLLAYHNIYHSWAWLGGHADGDHDLLHVAMKEIKEESSIQTVKPLSEEIASLEVLTVDGHIKHGHWVSSHLHLNVTYLFEADSSQSIHNKPDENSAVGWFELDEALVKCSEPWFSEHIYSKLNDRIRNLKEK